MSQFSLKSMHKYRFYKQLEETKLRWRTLNLVRYEHNSSFLGEGLFYGS